MFLRSRLQVKLLNLEPSHGLITIFKDLCFTGISCLTKSANKYLYFKFKNHVVSEQTKEKKLDVFKTILRKKSNMKMLWTCIRSIVNLNVGTQFSNISNLLDNGIHINDPLKMANLFGIW